MAGECRPESVAGAAHVGEIGDIHDGGFQGLPLEFNIAAKGGVVTAELPGLILVDLQRRAGGFGDEVGVESSALPVEERAAGVVAAGDAPDDAAEAFGEKVKELVTYRIAGKDMDGRRYSFLENYRHRDKLAA